MDLSINSTSLTPTPTNSAGDSKLRGVALGFELLTCFVGVITCCFSHYCLKTCKLIQSGMKIQLQILFTTDIVICLIALPGHAAIEYRILSGVHDNKTSSTVFTSLYTVATEIERATVMLIAIYRMMAVCFPFKYRYWSQKKVALLVNLIACSPVVLMRTIKHFIKDDSGIEAFDPNNYFIDSFMQFGFISAPTVITLIVYLVMALFMLCKKGSISPPDSCERSVRIFILTNTLFEVPDIIMHAAKATVDNAAFIIIHVIYRIHFALDPILFVGLNARYRQMVYQCCSSNIRVREAVTDTKEEDTLESKC
ncbi:uncharacterized protein LOC119586514 [Penaeus monodon]|uniref:uncharacterized protein LOC119586514 n=1 Tax=Penaeus monodon TaxID=6687 RepID=UPI0018A7A642|nr:uncharacterized protein LOC119586514 [Penaeus monodon]